MTLGGKKGSPQESEVLAAASNHGTSFWVLVYSLLGNKSEREEDARTWPKRAKLIPSSGVDLPMVQFIDHFWVFFFFFLVWFGFFHTAFFFWSSRSGIWLFGPPSGGSIVILVDYIPPMAVINSVVWALGAKDGYLERAEEILTSHEF